MFNNLQSLNKSSGSDLQKTEVIKSRLNELSTMRMGLFNQLKNMYKTDNLRLLIVEVT